MFLVVPKEQLLSITFVQRCLISKGRKCQELVLLASKRLERGRFNLPFYSLVLPKSFHALFLSSFQPQCGIDGPYAEIIVVNRHGRRQRWVRVSMPVPFFVAKTYAMREQRVTCAEEDSLELWFFCIDDRIEPLLLTCSPRVSKNINNYKIFQTYLYF